MMSRPYREKAERASAPAGPELRGDDLVQFARLLDAISDTYSELDFPALCSSMDLDPAGIDDLFDRAHNVWERAKALR